MSSRAYEANGRLSQPAYGANAHPLEHTARPFSPKVVMIAPVFMLRRLSHLPFHPGTR
ncbi:hypothetical protein GCM10022419_029680 [Nonomuraea rosea]|uniref:Uncharacterized protein n=1 Tax=Nonomuraea rosea TaxID=638574 RepID=A0ABP6W7Q8_9ACTN